MRVLCVASRYSDEPEQRLVTISRIKAAACPFRYFKEYLETPKPDKPFDTIEAGLGGFFHSYVEKHFREVMGRDGLISDQDILDAGDLVANFRLSFIWQGRLRPPYRVVRSIYNLEDFIFRLQRVGDNFNEFLLETLVGHRVVAVEGRLQIRAERYCIRGKYDLITQEHEQVVLWDWKTGRVPRPEYYEDYRNQKVQLGIYAVWMKHTFGIPDVVGTALFLRDGCDELSETFTEAVENEVLAYTAAWRRRLDHRTSYPAIPNNLCDWCGWNPVCPAHR